VRDDALFIDGIPASVSESTAALCRSRLLRAVEAMLPEAGGAALEIRVGTRPRGPAAPRPDDAPPTHYESRAPLYTFEQLVLPGDVEQELVVAVEALRLEPLVFDVWGLRAIEPYPRTALNFHGPPGTGKTMAAHALAHRLGRRILVASYAEIESKYHGDGPKNVRALFQAAERQGALLFVDEADSLLSKRLTQVTQGSEQAINSMRSQLLICLEQFRGVVVFATNLVENYDKAFETRVRHVRFSLPDLEGRREIWRRLLVPGLPLASDIDPAVLAEREDDVCGRDLKNAVLDAARRAAVAGAPTLTLEDLLAAVRRIKSARVGEGRPLTGEETEDARRQLAAHFAGAPAG
jgi:SpoVK/Ycf46/Vps4 family AAA+-type ATPase